MKRLLLSATACAGLAALGLAPLPAQADDKHLSPERLDMLDQHGYFTPGFKAVVHDLVNVTAGIKQANADQKELTQQLPDLKKQADDADAKTVVLRAELAKYDHPDETDFMALQARMTDATAKLEDQITLAQGYVWSYPSSPHESQAEEYLQQVQKKLADQQQAEKDAEAAREADRAKLVQRAEAHDLSLSEWRDFLRDMSQEDLLKYLGQPANRTPDAWIYSGEWLVDPTTNKKVGMEINFLAGRVLSVSEAPTQP
jgi:hypothetical protein